MVGPAVLDLAQHFIERWNEIKKRKVALIFAPRVVQSFNTFLISISMIREQHPMRDHFIHLICTAIRRYDWLSLPQCAGGFQDPMT